MDILLTKLGADLVAVALATRKQEWVSLKKLIACKYQYSNSPYNTVLLYRNFILY